MSYISQAAAVAPTQPAVQAYAAAQATTGAEGEFSKILAAQLGANMMRSTLRALDEDTSAVDMFGDIVTTAAFLQASGLAGRAAEEDAPVEGSGAVEGAGALGVQSEPEKAAEEPDGGIDAYGLTVVSAAPMGTLQVTAAGPTSSPGSVDNGAAADRALSRLGDPYSQSMRGSGSYVDCSYLAKWAYEGVGVNLPGTAAEQARYCESKGWTISRDELQKGDLVFWERGNCNCGRYREIHHVGIYLGDGRIVEASSSAGKVKEGAMWDNDGSWRIVMYARPA